MTHFFFAEKRISIFSLIKKHISYKINILFIKIHKQQQAHQTDDIGDFLVFLIKAFSKHWVCSQILTSYILSSGLKMNIRYKLLLGLDCSSSSSSDAWGVKFVAFWMNELGWTTRT